MPSHMVDNIFISQNTNCSKWAELFREKEKVNVHFISKDFQNEYCFREVEIHSVQILDVAKNSGAPTTELPLQLKKELKQEHKP